MGGKWEALVSKNQRILDKRVEEYCKEHPCHLLLLFIPSIALGAITSYLLIHLLFDFSFGLVMLIFLAIVFIPPILYYVHLRNYLLHPRNNDLHKVSQDMLCY